jgi:hypothetical protein
VLWGVCYLFIRPPFTSLLEIDLSEMDVIERERVVELPEKRLPWYRVLA